jgi:prepilin-type N-terminal cleavage/methylation domain-containing protein
MNFFIFKQSNRGFSLLELILAIAVFSLSSVALATLLIDANISTKLSNEQTEALSYAKEGIEATRAIRDASSTAFFALEGDYGLLETDGTWSFDGDSDFINDKYTRVINITNTEGANPATSSKNIISTISWNLTSGRVSSASLTTVLTNWHLD